MVCVLDYAVQPLSLLSLIYLKGLSSKNETVIEIQFWTDSSVYQRYIQHNNINVVPKRNPLRRNYSVHTIPCPTLVTTGAVIKS